MRSKICVSEIKSFLLLEHANASFSIELDEAELLRQKVTVNSAAVATTKFLSGMYDCTVHSDIGTDDFALMLGILHAYGHAHVGSHVFQCMNC